MKSITKVINIYDNLILKNPLVSLLLTLIIISFFALSIKDFKMDASADSLVLEKPFYSIITSKNRLGSISGSDLSSYSSNFKISKR